MHHDWPPMTLDDARRHVQSKAASHESIAEIHETIAEYLEEVQLVLHKLLPDWHADADEPSIHGGNVICEMTYADVRAIKSVLARIHYHQKALASS